MPPALVYMEGSTCILEELFLFYVFVSRSFAFQIFPDFMVASEDRRFRVHSSQSIAGLRVLKCIKNSINSMQKFLNLFW